jgi:hypothetical protein
MSAKAVETGTTFDAAGSVSRAGTRLRNRRIPVGEDHRPARQASVPGALPDAAA